MGRGRGEALVQDEVSLLGAAWGGERSAPVARGRLNEFR